MFDEKTLIPFFITLILYWVFDIWMAGRPDED